MSNVMIRVEAMNRGVHLWEIANRLGITDSSFSRKLRQELSQDEVNRIITIIHEIAVEKAG